MKKLTDDEIMAKALLCPESEKVPLEVGDRVIALEGFEFFKGTITDMEIHIPKGDRGEVKAIDVWHRWPLLVSWESKGILPYWGNLGPIGKLVKRGSV